MITDLPGTWEGLKFAVSHPIVTAGAIKDSIVEAWEENPDRVAGQFIFEVATFFIAPLKLAKAAKLRWLTKATRATKIAAETGEVLDTSSDVSKVVKVTDNGSELAQKGKRFLVRQEGFAYDLKYAELAERAVQDVGTKLKAGQYKSLREAMDDLATRRGAIAREMADPNAHDFGVARTENLYTPFDGKYAYAAERAMGTPDGSGYRAITATIDGEEVPLTLTAEHGWIHTNPQQIEKVMAHAETLYQKAMDPALSTEETLRTVGELHYYLAHAAPYNRGSAAISDMTTKAILDAKGISTPPWKPGVVPDIEALVTGNADDFAKRYSDMFETPPTRSP